MLSLEGRQLGNYDVGRRIRAGGMGAVYEGRQRTAFGRRVAIKVILGNYASDRDMRNRFKREALTVARLHHPHILPLIEFGAEQGVLYLVMPFIEGGTLTSFLRRELPALHIVSDVFLQLLDAVEYAHEEGLIHRDIKSSNVLLEARRSGAPHVYLADFGLVRVARKDESGEIPSVPTAPGTPIPLDQVPGTPQYMAPEQTRGIITKSTDIYALGILLYQMLVGELPYNDPDDIVVIKMQLSAPIPNPCDRDASIPAEVGEVVRKAMAKRPEQRFSNIAEFREAFLAALNRPVEIDDAETELDEEIETQLDDVEFIEPGWQRTGQLAPEALPLRRPRPEPVDMPTPPEPMAPGRPRSARPDPDEEFVGPDRQRAGRQHAAPRGVRGVRTARATPERLERLASPPVVPRKRLPPMQARAPMRKRHNRRFAVSVIVATAVPTLLLLLLLMPRVLGMSLFPSGFPLLGGAPVATISLTVQSRPISDTYLLTASPSVTQADIANRVIPARAALGSASDSRVVSTSGMRSIDGSQATGFLFFDNSSHAPAFVAAGFIFNSSAGVQIRLLQSVTVPPRQDGKDGTATGGAKAVLVGANGNISAGSISTSCCGQVAVSNPQSFSGGVDPSVVHLVAQADLDGVQNELMPGLRQRAMQQAVSHLAPGEVGAGQAVYKVLVTSDQPVGAQADQVNVTVSVSATVLIYNTQTARQIAQQLLTNQAGQTLGASYTLKGDLTVATPSVVQQSGGKLYLSVSAHGTWLYTVSQDAMNTWKQAIKGASPPLAQSYLSTQPGIASVKISLPFGTDHLPVDVGQIQFVIVNENG